MKEPQSATTLSGKQERFCQEYLTDLDGKQAAIRAGYSPKTAEVKASQLLRIVKVQQRIETLKAERKDRVDIDNDYVLKRLQMVVERCMQEEQVARGGKAVVVETPAGDLAGAFTFDATGATRALELLGKHIGLFEKDSKQKGIAELTTEDLIRMLDERETPEVKAERLRQLEAEIEEVMYGTLGEHGRGAAGGGD